MSRTAHDYRTRWLRDLLVAGALSVAFPVSAATLVVNTLTRDGKPLAGAVLMLESAAPGAAPAPPVKAIMDQVQLAFVPDVLVVPVHSTVLFPNSDAVSHQVYSFSSARQFQLPLYRGKPYPPVSFDQPGVVTLGCNIHDDMLAYIVVTAAAHFGRSGSHGEWSVADLPQGRYRLRLWHPLLTTEVQREVQVDTERADIELRLTKDLRPAPLGKRPHSWNY